MNVQVVFGEEKSNASSGFEEELAAAREEDAEMRRRAPRMVIMMGIPGSGKSTFSNELKKFGFVRVNQDELGTRAKCESKVADALINGSDVVIDRCNLSTEQRLPWVALANARGCCVGVVVMAVAVDECVKRATQRKNHPTIGESTDAARVVSRQVATVEEVSADEGIQFCRFVKNEDDFARVLREVSGAKSETEGLDDL